MHDPFMFCVGGKWVVSNLLQIKLSLIRKHPVFYTIIYN